MNIKQQTEDLMNKVAQAALMLREIEDDIEAKEQQVFALRRQYHELRGAIAVLRGQPSDPPTQKEDGGDITATPTVPDPQPEIVERTRPNTVL